MPNTTPRTPHDASMLGGQSVERFLAQHWQKKPLLIRGTGLDVGALPDRDALFALAARDDVESRLVTSFAGEWALESGPFDRLPRKRRDWSLLVQGVNLVDARADALMRRFDFVSSLRLDDLMISYAVDGGSVGPHFDSYDVFLLQLTGRRRWRWSSRSRDPGFELALVDGAPLKLLANFAPAHEGLLEPGDMLYLPPDCAHEGVAVGECTTASIGFRAPSWRELSREFLFGLAERDWPDGLYTDRDRTRTRTPASIDDGFVDAVAARLSRLRWDRTDVVDFVGRYFSEPKSHVFFDAPTPLSVARFVKTASTRGLALDLRTTLLYAGGQVYVAGERASIPRGARTLVARFANARQLAPDDCTRLFAIHGMTEHMHAWWNHGWIRFFEEARDGNDRTST